MQAFFLQTGVVQGEQKGSMLHSLF